MKNIHLIPTDKPSRLVLDTNNKNLFLTTNTKFPTDIMKFQNIFIINDEVPKLDEWAINTKNNVVFKCKGFTPDEYDKKYCKKIILTTDMDLIKDSIQPIDDEFLEWFVKNPSCKEVKVEGHIYKGQDETEYKIIIPKEKPKQVWEQIIETCGGKEEFMKSAGLLSKQETLEEAAERLYPLSAIPRKLFIIGAKWQQERSYSEEDMKESYAMGRLNKSIKDFNKKFNLTI